MTADKCTLCYHRITKGLTTACCEACPTGARQLVDLKNPKDPVHEFLRTHAVHVLKPQMATGAKVYLRRARRRGPLRSDACPASKASSTRTRSSSSGAC